MAVGRHFEYGFIAIRFQGRSHDKVAQFFKFNMADGRHNENRFSAIFGRLIF